MVSRLLPSGVVLCFLSSIAVLAMSNRSMQNPSCHSSVLRELAYRTKLSVPSAPLPATELRCSVSVRPPIVSLCSFLLQPPGTLPPLPQRCIDLLFAAALLSQCQHGLEVSQQQPQQAISTVEEVNARQTWTYSEPIKTTVFPWKTATGCHSLHP